MIVFNGPQRNIRVSIQTKKVNLLRVIETQIHQDKSQLISFKYENYQILC